ncbi:hypothetical protein [Pontibacter pamirensis]|uniref:hypothetical protein n=1 Tax=Pontibacter pamirensis TaxID=2562824 RepID=UPI001389BC23|nr:hypothetical protein [Pontibacter pamirensis]
MEEKEPQKRLLIKEDLQPLASFNRAIKAVFEKIKTAESAYNALGQGSFDDTVLKSIVSGGIERIYTKYMADAKATVDKLGIPNPAIKQNMLAGTGELFNPFRKAVYELNNLTFKPGIDGTDSPFPLDLISYVDGEPVLAADAEESFREAYCRTYISTPEEFAVYDSFQKVADAMNEFLPLLRKAQVSVSSYNLIEFNQLFHKTEEATVSFRPDLVKWLAQKMKNPNPYNL